MGNQFHSPKERAEPPIFGQFVLAPNGWMHQDATCYGGRPQPRRLCVSFPSPKGAQPPIFVQCPLWPNGWMDEDATWYGSRPRPRPHCIKRGPSSARKGHSSPPSFRPMCIVVTVAHLVWVRTVARHLHSRFHPHWFRFGEVMTEKPGQEAQSKCNKLIGYARHLL